MSQAINHSRVAPADGWMQARTITTEHRCCEPWCLKLIRRAKPGTTTGTRGAKAYWHPCGLWLCVACYQLHERDMERVVNGRRTREVWPNPTDHRHMEVAA